MQVKRTNLKDPTDVKIYSNIQHVLDSKAYEGHPSALRNLCAKEGTWQKKWRFEYVWPDKSDLPGEVWKQVRGFEGVVCIK